MDVWADDNSASLGSVARRAGVGRTTLNRYFTDRAELLAAVDEQCRHRHQLAVARSRPGGWIATVTRTSLFAGHLVVRAGTRTWHEAAGLLTRTLTSGLAPR